jgi:hypothetical protein
MSMLEEAMMYLDMGWAVYPVHSIENGVCSCGKVDCTAPGKHPMGKWAKYQDRLPSANEVYTWFTSMPTCNIGMVTGSVSSVVVVDVDSQKGLATYRSLGLPRTLAARTGGGGYHFFYDPRDEIVQSRVGVMEGIDLRGEGGFVVLSPSRHKSGRIYRFLRPRGLAPFDSSVFRGRGSTTTGISTNTNGWVSDVVDGVGSGMRNITAAKLAGRYASLGLSPQEVWWLIVAWNEGNTPPLEEAELRRTVAAILRKHEEERAQLVTVGQLRQLLGA